MSFRTITVDSIRRVNRCESLVSPSELDTLAADLGAELPTSYRAYLERLGRGVYCGLLSVFDPASVRTAREEEAKLRTLERTSQMWRNFATSFMPEDRERLCPIARSLDGDVVYFHLDAPSILAVMPRHRPEISVVESFEAALSWFSESGIYWQSSAVPWFDSDLARVEHLLALDDSRVDDVYDLLQTHAAEIATDVDVVEDRYGNPALLFVPSADALIEVFGSTLRITENVEATRVAASVRDVLLRHDVSVVRFEEKRRTGP